MRIEKWFQRGTIGSRVVCHWHLLIRNFVVAQGAISPELCDHGIEDILVFSSRVIEIVDYFSFHAMHLLSMFSFLAV